MNNHLGHAYETVKNAAVHVVREDPNNPDLLFAGTEFALYVSFNRGRSWERLKNGLPATPVFDLQIHPRDHALIVATHGRSIWILDDISPLEELSDSTLTTDLKLFTPRPGTEWRLENFKNTGGHREFAAQNPPVGVAIDYYTTARGPVRITIADKSGMTIRTINAQGEAGVVNHTVWNMQVDNPLPSLLGGGRGVAGGRAAAGAAAAFAGGRGGRGGAGLEVEPGEYVITVSQNGKTDQKTVTVADDPRLTLSAEDRAKRKAAMDRVISMAKDADTGRRKVLAVQTALNNLVESWKRPNAPAVPDNVKKAADGLLAKVKTVAATFEAPPRPEGEIRELGGAGAQPPYTPPPVLQKTARLMTVLSYPGPPLRRQLKDLEECGSELKTGLTAVSSLDDEVPRLNKLIQAAGVPYFTLDTNSVPPPATGRGGGPRRSLTGLRGPANHGHVAGISPYRRCE